MGIDRSARQITPKREPGCDRFCTDCGEALGSIRLPGSLVVVTGFSEEAITEERCR